MPFLVVLSPEMADTRNCFFSYQKAFIIIQLLIFVILGILKTGKRTLQTCDLTNVTHLKFPTWLTIYFK